MSSSVCQLCGKRPSFGNAVSRLGKKAVRQRVKGKKRRRWNPNTQRVRAVVNGTPRRINLCTGCIKAGRVHKR